MQMMDYYYGGMMSGWGIFALVFWILVIVGLALLIKYLWERRSGQESALDVLKKRYARGEITKEEFEEKKKDIL
jgi:putative membrane protein